MSKRAWWLSGCLMVVIAGPRTAVSVAGQASGISIAVDHPTIAAGDTLQLFLDADASGSAPVSVLVDGLGVAADSFVLRLPEAVSGWCPPPSTQCGRCPDAGAAVGAAITAIRHPQSHQARLDTGPPAI